MAARELRYWSVAANGTRTPFQGSGIRIPLDPSTWVAVDLRADLQWPFSVEIGGRAQRPELAPRLVIAPRAGDSAAVRIGEGSGPARLDVVIVDDTEFRRDIRGWLSRTTSGDPVGEVTLARPDRPTETARKFVIECGDIATVEVSVRTAPGALLVIDVATQALRMAPPGIPFPALTMVVRLHAANMASFCFEEIEGTVRE